MTTPDAPEPVHRDHNCVICRHQDRASIEMALVNGKGHREVARDFQIGSNPGTPDFRPDHKIVARHIDGAMGEAYRVAKADTLAASGRAMMDRLAQLDAVVDESIERLRAGVVVTHDGVPLLNPDGTEVRKFAEADIRGVIREARRNLELRSRLAGVTPEGDPDAADDARSLLLSAEARRAVTELEAMLAGDRSPEQGS